MLRQLKISPLYTHLENIWRHAGLQGSGRSKPLADRVQHSPPAPSREAVLAAMSCRQGHKAGGGKDSKPAVTPHSPSCSECWSIGHMAARREKGLKLEFHNQSWKQVPNERNCPVSPSPLTGKSGTSEPSSFRLSSLPSVLRSPISSC